MRKRYGSGAAAATMVPESQNTARLSGNIPLGTFDLRPAIMLRAPDGIFCLPADFATDVAARAIAEIKPVAADRLELARKHIVPGSIVLDIGAGFGRMSALFSGLTGAAGQVLAFEADEYLCDSLQQSIRVNQCENIRVFHAAIYDGSCTHVRFPAAPTPVDAPYSGQRIDPMASEGNAVETLTIDQLNINALVSFMYIDTNGCELQVLRGAVETIARFRMPIAFGFAAEQAHRFDSSLDTLRAFFHRRGYLIDRCADSPVWVARPKDSPAIDAQPVERTIAGAIAYPDVHTSSPGDSSLCKLLQSRAQVDACSKYLRRWGYVPHNFNCKNWDLAHIIPAIGDGNFLDMGSSDSYILKNLALRRIRGEMYGIDLRAPDVPISNVKYLIGDLMQTSLPSGYFANITCLSVLEHQVDYGRFATEASRLLAPNGRVFVTFDYWEPKVTPPIKLYGLDWMPLDAAMVRQFIVSCLQHGLELVEPFDFTTGDPLICGDYYSPHPNISYTFGMAVFRKR